MERKYFKVHEANILFLLLAIVFITVGASAQSWHIHIGLLITEYIIVFLPVLLAGAILKVDLKSALKLNPIKMSTIVKIVFISFLAIPAVATVNLIPIAILNHFDKVMLPEIPSPTTTVDFLISFFVIAISPGICEEVFFRGLVLNAYETAYNRKIGAIVAAVLFGIFHFNIQNLFGPMVIGLLAAYIMQITNSIYAAIAVHMANNGIAVVSDYLSTLYMTEVTEVSNSANALNVSTAELMTTISVMMVMAFIGLILIKLLINGLKRDTFYYALGEPFIMEDKRFYLVGKSLSYGTIIPREAAFDGDQYNLEAEEHMSWRVLNARRPRRIHDIWANQPYGETVDAKAFAPVVGVVCLYVYLLYQFLTYTG
ncbi:MAG: CPBP family intramembrane metalloprotease [Clostridia bacterium]|nr:CPBP family intramembrane metalloprotease [Clostridia bacterium]